MAKGENLPTIEGRALALLGEELGALRAEVERVKQRAEKAEAERDKWKGHFDSLSRSVKAEAESHKRSCAELAEKYRLKAPPDGRGARWGTDHDLFTITDRMGQREQAEAALAACQRELAEANDTRREALIAASASDAARVLAEADAAALKRQVEELRASLGCDEVGVTCACRWQELPKGAGATGPLLRECGEHAALRARVEALEKTLRSVSERFVALGHPVEALGAFLAAANAKLCISAPKDAALPPQAGEEGK